MKNTIIEELGNRTMSSAASAVAVADPPPRESAPAGVEALAPTSPSVTTSPSIATSRSSVAENARPRGSGFVAYENALVLLRVLAPIVAVIKEYNADLADQVTRAGTSIALNLQEGTGRMGRDRKRFFTMARGSAKEILGALDTADAWGWRVETAEARRVLDRELALLWGLCK